MTQSSVSGFDLVRYRRRKDANHSEITKALEAIGCSVLDLSEVGGGCPDLLVGKLCAGGRRGNLLLEVKNPANKRKSGSTNKSTAEKQLQFRCEWNGPVAVVETVEQAIAAALTI